MTLEDAIKEVLSRADEYTPARPVALETVRAYFRKEHGFQFEGDDQLGTVEPGVGDKIVFIPISELPPPDRRQFGGPMAGEIERVSDDPAYPGFPYGVMLDDATIPERRTRLWASREEIQIITRAGNS